MYLAGLRACEEMTLYPGEPTKAAEYRSIYENGRFKVDSGLWNREYYVQKVVVMPGLTAGEVPCGRAHDLRGLGCGGLTLVKAVSERYSGYNRNPWNQIECGYHYARAMASWSVKLALDGFTFSLPNTTLGFAPKINQHDFRTFWSTGTGWGVYTQKPADGSFGFEVLHGEQSLSCLNLADLPSGDVSVTGPAGHVPAHRDGPRVMFDPPLALLAGESVRITVG